MMATVAEAQGVGLAAPQVYQSKRIFIIAWQPNARYPDAPQMQPTAMLNPEIVSLSDKIEKDWEGCLSIPGIRGLVPRHHSLKLKYLTRDGRQVTEEFTGFIACIIQHEIDHLEGIFFLDRMENNREIVSEKEYLRIIREQR
jgi:peptide deformylase